MNDRGGHVSMRFRFAPAVGICLWIAVMSGTAAAQGEHPDPKPRPTNEGHVIPGPKPPQPQCTADGAEYNQAGSGCYASGQRQMNDMNTCPPGFAIAGG